jgi:hypothetical protein
VLGTAFGVPNGSYPAPKATRLDYLGPGFIRYHPHGFIRPSFWLDNPLDSTANAGPESGTLACQSAAFSGMILCMGQEIDDKLQSNSR